MVFGPPAPPKPPIFNENTSFWCEQPLANVRYPIQQQRHMDVAKYLFECGGALASSARSSGGFGMRGKTEPFCLCVDDGNIDGTAANTKTRSFMVVPYDNDIVCDWYTGDNQVGFRQTATFVPADSDTISSNCTKSKCGLVTGFPDFTSVKKTFPDGTLVNFDTDWLNDNTDLAGFPASFIVGNTSARDFTALRGGHVDVYANGTPFFNTGLYAQAILAATGTQYSNKRADTFVFAERVNAGSANFRARGLRMEVADAQENFGSAQVAACHGRQFQLANVTGLPSTNVYFEPNDVVAKDLDLDRNPAVTYCVWEVYDIARLKAQAVLHARGQIQGAGYYAGAAIGTSQFKVNEIAYNLSQKNLKKDQVLAAWIPSNSLRTLLHRLDNMNDAGTAVSYTQLNGGPMPQGQRPLYAQTDDDGITATYNTAKAYSQQLRHDAFELNAIGGTAANRKNFFQALIIEIEKVSGVNCFGAVGNGQMNTFETIGGHVNGEVEHLNFIIPLGTRIRLKTFTHVGLKTDTQCLGPINPIAQAYTHPKTLRIDAGHGAPTSLAFNLDGTSVNDFNGGGEATRDFNWEEQRGRFPYQVIQPMFDGYSDVNTPSRQGKTGFMYEDAIKNIQLSWRDNPELVCEWVILPRSKVQPTYRLAYPQHEFFRALYPSPKFNLPAKGTQHEIAVRGVKLNEVPNKVYVYCMLTEDSRNYLEWLDIKPTITGLETTINETVDTTSHIPLWLGYRFFKENCPYSQKTKDEWVQDNCWVLAPQQLNITAETFTESMARISTLSIKATVQMNRAYRQISSNYSPALFAGLPATGKSVMTPEFELRVVVTYDNHSIIINSKNEMMIEKNTLGSRGPTGLIREDRNLPRQGGLAFY